MTVVKCGTNVYFGDIPGVICAVEITYTNVLYKFGYFDKELNYKTLWCHESELKMEKPQKSKIGFKNVPIKYE